MKLETFRKSVDEIASQLEGGSLTLGHLGLFVFIARHVTGCISVNDLAQKTNVSHNTLRGYIKDLKSSGILTVEVTRRGISFTCNEVIESYPSNSGIPDPSIIRTIITTTNKTPENKNLDIHKQIIEDLNKVGGRNFKLDATDTLKKINWLLSHGYTFEDFQKVHRAKRDWLVSPKMSPYYRPKTLYAQENFESYLNERPVVDSAKATTSKWKSDSVLSKVKERQRKLEDRWGGVEP